MTLGLPEQLVTDNGSSFSSEEFQQFYAKQWGAPHQNITTSSGGTFAMAASSGATFMDTPLLGVPNDRPLIA